MMAKGKKTTFKTLRARIKALIEKGEPFHQELAEIHTHVAKKKIKKEDISSFMDIVGLTPESIAAFSHLKSVEFAGVSNWVRLTEGLMMGFLLTDLKGTTAEDIKMPLPSFLIELPPGSVYTYSRKTGYHETLYIIVTEATIPPHGETLFIYSQSAPNENSTDILETTFQYFSLSLDYRKETLSDVIYFQEEMSPATEDTGGKIFGEEYYGVDFREKLLRIVVNTIIYMTSASAVVEHENQDEIDKLSALKERGKLKLKGRKRLEQLENTPHFVLGTDITITHADVEAIKKAQKDDRNRGKSGRQLKHPSITRGHWRWQRHGPKLSLVKRIWIKPFIRGKELGGEGGGHTYILENPFDFEAQDEYYDDYYEG